VADQVKPHIRSLHFDEFGEKLSAWNEPAYRAKQIADWLYQKRVGTIDEMSDLSRDLRSRLAAELSLDQLETVRILGSRDTTQKFLFRLNDRNLIESVLIPASPALYGSGRIGEPFASRRKSAALMAVNFARAASMASREICVPHEIVDQVIAVEQASGERIDNIVFMGMGEPLANLKI